MREFVSKVLRIAGRTRKLSYNRVCGLQRCPACDFNGEFVSKPVLWPELIAQWELSPQWVHWFDQREGCACARFGSSLRSGQLAQAITDQVCKMTGARGLLSATFLKIRAS